MARELTTTDVDRLLTEVGRQLEDPPHSGLAGAVLARLEPPPAFEARVPRDRLAATRRLGLVAALVTVVAIAVVASVPSTRHAVADWLGLRGVQVDQQNGSPPTDTAARRGLGEEVTLADAQQRVAFDILLPPELGVPDEVYVAETPSGGRVTLLYLPRPDLPVAKPSDIGLLVTEFRAEVPDVVLRKGVPAGTSVEPVTVNGEAGLWFHGAPHSLTFSDANGRLFAEGSRLAGNTMIWERGDLTVRLEAALSRGRAIRLASSLVVIDGGR